MDADSATQSDRFIRYIKSNRIGLSFVVIVRYFITCKSKMQKEKENETIPNGIFPFKFRTTFCIYYYLFWSPIEFAIPIRSRSTL